MKVRKVDDGCPELHSFEYRLSELLMICEGVAIGMDNNFVFNVWGALRFGPNREMRLLASVSHDLHKAVEIAWNSAQDMQRPQIRTAAWRKSAS